MEQNINEQVQKLEMEIYEKKGELAKLRKQISPQKIDDFEFTDFDGKTIKLSELFGDKDELVVVHNMGKGCAWCTMWADGFNGIYKYIETRCGFVVESPDDTQTQKEFYKQKGWGFKMVSSANTYKEFRKLTKGLNTEGGAEPAISSFVKKDGEIYLHAATAIGPRDNFCVTYDILDLLPTDSDAWDEKFVPKVAFNEK